MPKRPGWHELRFVDDPTKAAVRCTECSRAMWLPASKADLYKRCGPACNEAWRNRLREERRRECATCGETFYPRLYQIHSGGGIFCSQTCNTRRMAALSAPEAQALAVLRMREKRAAGLVKYRSGPDNPKWKGGKQAYLERARASGRQAEWRRTYRKKNPHKVKEFTQRRSGLKVGRLPSGTIPRIGEAQKWRCAVCRKSIKKGYHVDHIMPLARGGEHVAQNIQLLCPTCNVRKSAKDPIDFMQSLGRLL